MMVAEIGVGMWTHSLALTADGWHMGSHAAALGLSLVGYWAARRYAAQLAFGLGKTNAISAYTSALLLLAVAAWMIVESVARWWHPLQVSYREALPIAVVGLLVNLVSMKWLGHHHEGHEHAGDHHHAQDSHLHEQHDDHQHPHNHKSTQHTASQPTPHGGSSGTHDASLRAAYLHVAADALTSVLALLALGAGYFFNVWQVDALVGLLGALLIAWWSVGLLRETVVVLADCSNRECERRVRAALQSLGARIADLHVWGLGANQFACVITVASANPAEILAYRKHVLASVALVHLTIEIHACGEPCE